MLLYARLKYAGMVELADTQDLGSCGDRAGSSPVTRTKKELFQTKQLFFGKVYQLILYLIISSSELLQGYQIFRQVFS